MYIQDLNTHIYLFWESINQYAANQAILIHCLLFNRLTIMNCNLYITHNIVSQDMQA